MKKTLLYEDKKQFEIDALEIIHLMEKGWESPRYLAPSVFAEAKGKYEILEVKYPSILESDIDNGGDYRVCFGYLFRLMLIYSDRATDTIMIAKKEYADYVELKDEIKRRILE